MGVKEYFPDYLNFVCKIRVLEVSGLSLIIVLSPTLTFFL